MTGSALSPPPIQLQVVTAAGTVTGPWSVWFSGVFQRLGGAFDKVDAAHATSLAAVPKTTNVVANGGLHSGGPLSSDVGLSLYRYMVTVAALPTLGNTEGDWSYAVNGRKPGESSGAGTGVPVFWSHGNWIAVTSGAIVTT